MKYFYSKNKRSIWTFVTIFAFLLLYDIFLIPSIMDLKYVTTSSEIANLYKLHPSLPLPRIIKSLFGVQYFVDIGFLEVLKTFTFVVNGLNIFDIIFLVVSLIVVYQFLFKKDHVNSLTFYLLLSHLVIFIIHMTIVGLKLYDSFVSVNESIVITMNFIETLSIIVCIVYFVILALSLILLRVMVKYEK